MPASSCSFPQVAYSEFLTLVHSGNVKTAGIDDSADKIYFNLNGHSSQQAAEAAPVEAAVPAAAPASSSAPASASAVEASSGEFADCTMICTDAVLHLVGGFPTRLLFLKATSSLAVIWCSVPSGHNYG